MGLIEYPLPLLVQSFLPFPLFPRPAIIPCVPQLEKKRFPGLVAAILATLLIAGLSGCAACASSPRPRLPPPPSAFKAEAGAVLAGLSLEEKCGQVLLIAVPGKERLSPAAAASLRAIGPGGILLFGYNVGEEAEGLAGFIGDCQDAAGASGAGLPLIVAIDHEGGSVFRFKRGLTPMPPAAAVGSYVARKGPAYALALGQVSGRELSALGVNLALAPVVELATPANSAFLGSRSYGSDGRTVDAAAGAFILGLESSGVGAVAKHFPGNTGADPHKGLAVIGADRAELEKDYFPRFKSAARRGASAVLLSHALVPALDADNSATLSPTLVQGELRKRLGFEGLVVTDDLFMKGLTERMPAGKAAVRALAAGADLLMLADPGSGPSMVRTIARAVASGELPESRLDEAVLHVLELKLRHGMKAGLDPVLRAERAASLPALVEEDAAILARFKD
jgi:beta-N-acetylhexosaminidase